MHVEKCAFPLLTLFARTLTQGVQGSTEHERRGDDSVGHNEMEASKRSNGTPGNNTGKSSQRNAQVSRERNSEDELNLHNGESLWRREAHLRGLLHLPATLRRR